MAPKRCPSKMDLLKPKLLCDHSSSGTEKCNTFSNKSCRYRIIKYINSGSLGNVYEVQHIFSLEHFAVKVIKKANLKPKETENIHREINIHKQLKHPNIIQFVGHWETVDAFYIVTELCLGGDLLDYVEAKAPLKEADAKKVAKAIVSALTYCRSKGVLHRDIKPENVFLGSPNNFDKVKLADFGLAFQFQETEDPFLTKACGTLGYLAPEMMCRQPYTHSADVYSFGVTMYFLLTGKLPFPDEDPIILLYKVTHQRPPMPAILRFSSAATRDLLTMCLQVSPLERCSLDELATHEFLRPTQTEQRAP
eukprot:NODE_551_length_1374_cov_301.445068_g515_i0.p1 GENE.NODE_551_length_1374_cov_301.445068_g515_i0~~NODE_551_length_1374_cov_301.445068_g515_i0.p1  ORF type:complete len:308 (-),score=50.63 NODE_551_length_1374_cov_301.445068_g515_i0:123-1046(-)